ncbi:B12-binding domain-containing radical SAM protein [Candidatus Gracilibacteria bacterium]|nr:B12-binding domain-containing radical SAM protein [Candidatus Gracilibacteria bacterium]
MKKTKNKKDIIFFSSPIQLDARLADNLIVLGQPCGEIPNGILHIASYLDSFGIRSIVVPIDAFLYKKQFVDISHLIESVVSIFRKQILYYDPDILAFEMMYTFNSDTVLDVIKKIKEMFPQKLIIIGGNHATFCSGDILNPSKNNGVDIVIRGEGEFTTKEIVEAYLNKTLDKAKIQGISYLHDGSIIHNTERLRGDLKHLPQLNYNLILLPDDVNIIMFNHSVMFTRACKGNCTFCTSPSMWNRQITSKTSEKFKSDLLYLVSNGVFHISVWDDDIFVTDESFNQVVAVLLSIKLLYPNVNFYVQSRVSHFRNSNKKIHNQLDLLKKAGVIRIHLGVESGSQIILDAMNKNYKAEWIFDACSAIKEHDIEVGVFIIIGHPGSSAIEEQVSYDLIQKLFINSLIDDMQCHILSPLPGSAVASDARLKIASENVNNYGIVYNYPVYDLVDQRGNITFSQQEIWLWLLNFLDLRQQYLGLDPRVSNKLKA